MIYDSIKSAIIALTVTLILAGCSIMIINHSHRNVVTDDIKPTENVPIEFMGKGNAMEVVRNDSVDSNSKTTK